MWQQAPCNSERELISSLGDLYSVLTTAILSRLRNLQEFKIAKSFHSCDSRVALSDNVAGN
jgi:hypothetical protein